MERKVKGMPSKGTPSKYSPAPIRCFFLPLRGIILYLVTGNLFRSEGGASGTLPNAAG